MSLQRGSFGIEFDEREGFQYNKLWWAVVPIPVVALAVLLIRGCGGDAARTAFSDDPTQQSRQEASELKAAHERPSVLKHLLQTWWSAPAESRREAEAPAAAPESRKGWLASVPPKVLSAVQKQSPEVKRLLEQVAACETGDDLVGERLIFRQLLVRKDAEAIRAFVERKIGEINTALLFSDRPSPEKVRHRVAAGDMVAKLVKRYGNTQDYLLKANGIDKPELLRIGREIWVLKNPVFELTVFKKGGSAVLTLNGLFFKRYPVGVGKAEDSPNGTYVVRSRTMKTIYSNSEQGSDTPSAKWISLAATGETPEVAGFGLHGTWNEAALGRQVDAGRIRFSNTDIAELYVLLPAGALVNVTE